MTHSDQDLRERFAALRGEDAEQTPGFAALDRRRTAAPRPWRRSAMVLAALALVATLVFKLHQRPEPPPRAGSITEWKSPTDFLLQTPGHELLRSVPVFTQWPDSTSLPAATPKPFSKTKS